jgi:glycosyltransferase involved in cell wall biosynthesis
MQTGEPTMPRFSIIITCYNQLAFIRDAVGSALNQNYTDREIIVVDDASTDGSKTILEEFGDSIKLIPLETNEGVSAARNRAAFQAGGDFLVFLDGDDLLLPWALTVYHRIIDLKNPKVILCNMLYFKNDFSSVNIGKDPREIRIVDYEAYMKKDRPYRSSASAMVIERQSFYEVGGFTKILIEDAEILLKLGYSGRTIMILQPPTKAFRWHVNNFTHQIQRIIEGIHGLIRREKLGQYPGGRAGRSERYGVLGGIAFHWLKKSFQAKLYRKWLKLLAVAWPMVMTAIYRRVAVVLRGRRPEEILTIGGPGDSSHQ